MVEFYRDDIAVSEWLNNTEKQKIEFNDRTEYRVKNMYHRINGPAIEFKVDTGNSQYYIMGELMNESDWKIKSTQMLRSLKLKAIDSQ